MDSLWLLPSAGCCQVSVQTCSVPPGQCLGVRPVLKEGGVQPHFSAHGQPGCVGVGWTTGLHAGPAVWRWPFNPLFDATQASLGVARITDFQPTQVRIKVGMILGRAIGGVGWLNIELQVRCRAARPNSQLGLTWGSVFCGGQRLRCLLPCLKQRRAA